MSDLEPLRHCSNEDPPKGDRRSIMYLRGILGMVRFFTLHGKH